MCCLPVDEGAAFQAQRLAGALAVVTLAPEGTKTLTCPHCGLVLTITRVRGGTRLSYDAHEWRRLCKHPDLVSPVLCLLARDGDGGAEDADGVIGRR